MESSPISSQTLPTGTRVEEFVIERILGSGGFGITYLATDTALGRRVVIKENLPAQFCFRDPSSLTVAPRHSSGEDVDNFQWSLENFSKESAMLASLDHPGIVRVLRSFEAFGTAYFVMPYVEGVALDELSKQRNGRPFTEEELRELLEWVLDALGYLHDRGIYHRDIKPGNLLITDEGFPVLIDFGSARQRLSERSLTVVESAGYTPFEQLQTRGNVGPWSDLYALAATLVKTMTGEAPPKANDRTMGDSWQPLVGQEKFSKSYSVIFLHCLDRALKLPVEERWQNAKDWRREIAGGRVQDVAGIASEGRRSIAEDGNENKRLPKLFIATVAAALVLGLWAWLAAKSGGESAGAIVDQVLATGALVITSDPVGARVVGADGFELGMTPVELEGLAGGGTWEGTVEMEGYGSAAVLAEVPTGGTKLLPMVKLQAELPNVMVTSEPSGAEVLEGNDVLGVTPWEGGIRAIGAAVRFTLRKQGYLAAEVSGEVAADDVLVLQGLLQPQLQKVFVASDPEGAEVLEEGSVTGMTPFERMINPGTEISYHFRLEGYKEARVTGTVQVGESLTLSAKLIPDENTEIKEESDASIIENPKEKLKDYVKKAENGDSEAMWMIGRIHDEGVEGFSNKELALDWYKKSAEMGSREGMYLYALANEFGEGCVIDKKLALYYYNMAADKEHEESQKRLSSLKRELEAGDDDATKLKSEDERTSINALHRERIDLTDIDAEWTRSQGALLPDYTRYIWGLKLKTISPKQFIEAHATSKGAVWNSLPPKEWWTRMGYTLRVVDRVALEMNVTEVKIISAYRSPAYNALWGGDVDSWHQANLAVDFTFPGRASKEVARVAKNLRDRGLFKGAVGTHGAFTHLDTRGENINLDPE